MTMNRLRERLEGGTSLQTVLLRDANHDPIITPLIVAGLGAVGITGPVATAIGAIATAGIAYGIQSLMAPRPPRAEDGKAPLAQEIPYCIWAIGRRRLAGAFMLWDEHKDRLYGVQALAAHPCNGVVGVWLHDDEVAPDPVTGIVPEGSDGRYGGDLIKVETRMGESPGVPYADHVAAFSSAGLWTSSHRGDGQTSIGWSCDSPSQKNVQKRLPYGPPRVSVELEGARLFDPRDPTQSSTNPATWKYSDNSVLALLWHECFNPFGSRRDYAKAIAPVVDLWKAEADVCDESVALLAGGSEKRYRCAIWDTAQNDPKVGTNAILTSMDGWMCERGDGALLVVAGKYRPGYVGTITDADIVGIRMDYDVMPADEINRLIPRFVYPDTDYSEADTDYFEDVADQLTAGRPLAVEARYDAVTSWTQARRLAIRDWRRARQKLRGTKDIRLSGVNAAYRRWNLVQSTFFAPELNGRIVELRKVKLALGKGVYQAQFVLHPDNIDAWNPATDEGAKPPVPPKPTSTLPGAPVLVQARLVPAEMGVIAEVVVEEPEDLRAYDAISRWRRLEGGVWSDWVYRMHEDLVIAGGQIVLRTGQVPTGADIEITAAWQFAGGAQSDYFDPPALLSPGSVFGAPDPVTDADATGETGSVEYSWTAPNDTRFAGVHLYYSSSNQFATATKINPSVPGAPGAAGDKTVSLASGNYYGWVESYSRTGVTGDPVATGSFTIT